MGAYGVAMTGAARVSAVLVVWALTAGCASQRAQALIRKSTADHVYTLPRDALWPSIRAWVQSRGWVTHELQGRYVIVSDWEEDLDGHTYARYQVEALEARDGGTAVRILRQSQNLSDGKLYFKRTGRPEQFMMTTLGPTHTKRAIDLELELMRRLDGARARQIEDAARVP